MKYTFALLFSLITLLVIHSIANAQIPVELFKGHQKTTLDILFFKFIKNKDSSPTKLLFFNRNRASVDDAMTATNNLPQFGFTEAISYNNKKLHGFAPVVVISFLNKGVYPKTGIQYSKNKNDYSIFSWVVIETLKEPNIDFFLLGRYTPKLTQKINLFLQAELVNTFPTATIKLYSFTQRFRLGVKLKVFQIGAGLDITQLGRNKFTQTQNLGGFIRYEF